MRAVRKLRNEEGFTLIELLIVIIVLAILAAIVVFAVGGTTTNATISSCKADAKTVEVAIQAYDAQTGTFPSTWSQIISASSVVNTIVQGANSFPETTTIGPYLRQQPGATHYIIQFNASGQVWVSPPGTTSVYATGLDYDLTGGTSCDVAH